MDDGYQQTPWRRFATFVGSVGGSPGDAVALALLTLAALTGVGLLWLLSGAGAGPATTGGQRLGVLVEEAGENGEATVSGPVGSELDDAAGVTPGQADAPPERVLVHVAGAVHRPGVYELEPGARASDAVAAAGGFVSDAAPETLNLARPVDDGEQLVVLDTEQADALGPVPAVVEPGSATGDTVVDLNRADAAQLETLPGVGPVLALRIIEHRETVGAFTEVGQLRDVPGIGEKTFQALAERVRV